MGTSFRGSFKQFAGIRNSVPLSQQTDPEFQAFSFSSSLTGSPSGFYTANSTGTPTFTTALNSHTSQQVMKLDRGAGGDTVTISGDMAFMHGDFSLQFWLYIPSNGALNGDMVINAGNRIRMRSTGSGNAYADFEFIAFGGDAQFVDTTARLDVDRWNHITIGKATGVGPGGEGPQKFNGTRAGIVRNGVGGVSTIQRWDNTYASVGSSEVSFVNPSEAQFLDTITLGGANMYIANFKMFGNCLINLYDRYQTYFVPPNWDDFN